MFDKFDTDGSGEIDRCAPDNAPLRLMKAVESRLDAIEIERLAPAVESLIATENWALGSG